VGVWVTSTENAGQEMCPLYCYIKELLMHCGILAVLHLTETQYIVIVGALCVALTYNQDLSIHFFSGDNTTC
jgi:hypothetical protein